ncbi:MAG: biosynthetic arginine decarboxylase [Thermoanaerobaculia bacterium]
MKKIRREPWTKADSVDLYGIEAWGRDYFSVDDQGHLRVGPGGAPGVDLKELVDKAVERGIAPPMLIRFSDLLKARLDEIHDAFRRAIEDYEYQGAYRGVYPIKVNQDRHLVHHLTEFGRRFHYGLEAGSKPELMAVMAMLDDEQALVICNGYKDEEYIETALLASRLGPRVVLVVEKPAELPLIVAAARKTGVEPRIGVRARLAARGAGHWEASGGDRSKFGLGPRELVETVEFLRGHGLLESLVLLHFHLGSQISSIRNLKDALREAGRLYVSLVKMGVPLVYFDVGGGLGVDYDGSQTNYPSSMNYTLQEYANDVVAGVMEVCDPAGVGHPVLVTEAGRATVAHHAVLVTEVLGVGEREVGEIPSQLPEGAAPVLHHLHEAYREITSKNLLESYHDVLQYRDECLSLFNLGHLTLEHRVVAEDLFWAACLEIHRLALELPEIPEELRRLESALADTYLCNFSVFQSLPDSWAIGHLFPILPIHRLDERPGRRGVLVDMTCDSDGRVDRFIDPREVRTVLELHRVHDEPYYLGIFLVGAYQETLGDLHNLFGDANAVHVALEPGGGYRIEHLVEGDSVQEVLSYVGYPRDLLMARLRRNSEQAIRDQRMSRDQARELLRLYESGLGGYSYPEREEPG